MRAWLYGLVFILLTAVVFFYGLRHHDAASATAGNDMRSRLKLLNDSSNFPLNLNQSDQIIEFLTAKLQSRGLSANDSLIMLFSLADNLLRSGHSYKSIEHYVRLKQLMKEHGISALSKGFTPHDIDREIAVGRFRLSEQLNCQLTSTAASCIFPFEGSGVHQLTDDARESRALLLQLLSKKPDDATSKWLLNIENSALGYPVDSIPEAYRINMKKYEAPVSLKPFNNVAIAAGVSAPGLAGGAATEDFNNDGLMDIMVSSCGLYDPLRVFINKGDGTFNETTQTCGLDGITGGLNLTTCDYNNDGWMDIYLMRGGWMTGYGNFPNSLLRNNGNGTFSDVTIEAGLYSLHPTHSSVWVDFNHDGWLDLFVGHESSEQDGPHYSEFYISNGNGTFTECAQQAGLRVNSFIKGAVFTDIDNDGWQDLYLSSAEGSNFLFKNNGPGKNNIPQFTDVTKHAGVENPYYSFSVLAADINNDGWEDIFVAGYVQLNQMLIPDMIAGYNGANTESHACVYINQKNGTYAELSKEYKMQRSIQAMGLNFGDLDNDGFPDIYCGTGNPDFKSLFPNTLLHNRDGKYFEDVTIQTRTGNLQKGHGIAFCDIDNDGDEDIYEDMGGFFKSDLGNNTLFENPGSGNNFIGLQLKACESKGISSDKNCVGARIEVVINENGTKKRIYKTVCNGGSFGANSYRQLIGIGKATEAEEINIFYPVTGQKQTFKKITAGKYYEIQECSNAMAVLNTVKYRF